MNDGPSSTDAKLRHSPLGWWRRLTANFSSAPRSREDLQEMLEEAREEGLVDADSAEMIEGVFGTRDLQARDIMVPRAQMVCIESDQSLPQILAAVIESGHSRYPIIGDTKDEIIGILLAKDLLKFTTAAATFDLHRVMRPAIFVPESKRVNILLKDFRRSHNHMAIVADEYGGVAGLVTIEDILETIVGQIDDEHDDVEVVQAIIQQDDRRFLVQALTPIAEFNQQFNADFSDHDFDTVGGLVIHHLGHLPHRGENITIGRFQFSVQKADSRRVQLLQLLLSQD